MRAPLTHPASLWRMPELRGLIIQPWLAIAPLRAFASSREIFLVHAKTRSREELRHVTATQARRRRRARLSKVVAAFGLFLKKNSRSECDPVAAIGFVVQSLIWR